MKFAREAPDVMDRIASLPPSEQPGALRDAAPMPWVEVVEVFDDEDRPAGRRNA